MRPSIDSLCADAQCVVMDAERAARRDESRRVRQVDTCVGSQPLGTLKPLHGRNVSKELWAICDTDRRRRDVRDGPRVSATQLSPGAVLSCELSRFRTEKYDIFRAEIYIMWSR